MQGKRFQYFFIGDEEEDGGGKDGFVTRGHDGGAEERIGVIFGLPNPDFSRKNETQYFPTTTLDRGGPITFDIPATDKEYIDPRKVFLYMKIRILDENGVTPAKVTDVDDAAIPPKSFLYPINYFHVTCFKTVNVYVNNKNVIQRPLDNLLRDKDLQDVHLQIILNHPSQ